MVGFGSQKWSLFLRETLEKRRPGSRAYFAKTFKWIPEQHREGPWATLPMLFLGAMFLGAVYAAPKAIEDFQPVPQADELFLWRLLGFLVGAGLLVWMFVTTGVWPLLSWTILGWTCFTVRYLCGILGLTGAQRILSFPALLSNTVTVLLWYTVIVPGMFFMNSKKHRLKIVKGWVCGPVLITVHGLNEVFAVADWYMQPIRFNLFDLWVGTLYCLCYVILYLGILDPLGMHFYFILSPRKWWGALIYAGIFLLMYCMWAAFNLWEATLSMKA